MKNAKKNIIIVDEISNSAKISKKLKFFKFSKNINLGFDFEMIDVVINFSKILKIDLNVKLSKFSKKLIAKIIFTFNKIFKLSQKVKVSKKSKFSKNSKILDLLDSLINKFGVFSKDLKNENENKFFFDNDNEKNQKNSIIFEYQLRWETELINIKILRNLIIVLIFRKILKMNLLNNIESKLFLKYYMY